MIEGVYGNYIILYDGGGYDLAQPASSITALLIYESMEAAEEHLALLRYMAEFNGMTNNVQNYPAAMTAYASALNALRYSTPETAAERLSVLQSAVGEYEALLDGDRYYGQRDGHQGRSSCCGPCRHAYGRVRQCDPWGERHRLRHCGHIHCQRV
jgi:hypothetical protein